MTWLGMTRTEARTTALGIGMMLVSLFTYAALAGDDQAHGAVATTDPVEICDYVTIATPSGTIRLSYSQRHRKLLLEDERKADFARAGVPWSQRVGTDDPRARPPFYVLDHLVNLSIGGADVPNNRRPEELEESKLKDKVEDALWEALCHAHSISAPDAQAIFLSGNWRNELWRVRK